MTLTRTVTAGPSTNGSAVPRRLDVLGHSMAGQHVPWTFETLAGGVPRPAGRADLPPPAPVWRLRPGFGVTEAGCIVVGLALALARTPGAGEAGDGVIRRRRLDPRQDVVVVPEAVRAVRPLTELPLAVLVTALEDPVALLAELRGTTRWVLSSALVAAP